MSEKIRATNAYGDTVWIPYGVASADGEGERDAPCADATVGGVRLTFVWQRHFPRRAAQVRARVAPRGGADVVVLSSGLWDLREVERGNQSRAAMLDQASALGGWVRDHRRRGAATRVIWRSTTPTTNELLALEHGRAAQPHHVAATEPLVIDRLAPAGVEVLNATAAMRAFLARAESGEELARRTLMSDPGDRSKAHRQQVLARKARKRRDTAAADAAGAADAARAGARMLRPSTTRTTTRGRRDPEPLQALLLRLRARRRALCVVGR